MKRRDTPAPTALDLNAAQLLKQPTGVTREYDLTADARGIDPTLDLAENLSAHVKLTRTKSGALLALAGKTSLRVPCSRCLEPVVIPVELNFEEELLQTVDVVTGLPLTASRDDPAVLIDGHHDIRLSSLIREYLLVAQPMHVLCRADCKGLCPQCGQNLNLGDCGHSAQPVDERWAALKSLLEK